MRAGRSPLRRSLALGIGLSDDEDLLRVLGRFFSFIFFLPLGDWNGGPEGNNWGFFGRSGSLRHGLRNQLRHRDIGSVLNTLHETIPKNPQELVGWVQW